MAGVVTEAISLDVEEVEQRPAEVFAAAIRSSVMAGSVAEEPWLVEATFEADASMVEVGGKVCCNKKSCKRTSDFWDRCHNGRTRRRKAF